MLCVSVCQMCQRSYYSIIYFVVAVTSTVVLVLSVLPVPYSAVSHVAVSGFVSIVPGS